MATTTYFIKNQDVTIKWVYDMNDTVVYRWVVPNQAMFIQGRQTATLRSFKDDACLYKVSLFDATSMNKSTKRSSVFGKIDKVASFVVGMSEEERASTRAYGNKSTGYKLSSDLVTLEMIERASGHDLKFVKGGKEIKINSYGFFSKHEHIECCLDKQLLWTISVPKGGGNKRKLTIYNDLMQELKMDEALIVTTAMTELDHYLKGHNQTMTTATAVNMML